MPRKRSRRSQAFPESDEEDSQIINERLVSDGQPSNDLDKERDVWDSFREEHFEAVDQMPLTLHRHYALMQELDQQAHSYIEQLLPTIQGYISKRREMADQLRIPAPLAVTSSNSSVLPDMGIPFKAERLSSPRSSLTTPADESLLLLEYVSVGNSTLGTPRIASFTTTQPSAPSDHAGSPETTRHMLSHIAWLADELSRASEEKVNLVQAAFDSVDRHVRILDQAITEQEKHISLGALPSCLAPTSLPELVVPRLDRPSRTMLSPADEDEDDFVFARDAEYSGPISDGITSEAHGLRRSGKRGRIHDREQLFCYCSRPSFGKMVACDNKKCETEWFHVDCLGLRETLEGSWYCSDKCRASARRKRK